MFLIAVKETKECSPSQGDDDDFINLKADLDGGEFDLIMCSIVVCVCVITNIQCTFIITVKGYFTHMFTL